MHEAVPALIHRTGRRIGRLGLGPAERVGADAVVRTVCRCFTDPTPVRVRGAKLLVGWMLAATCLPVVAADVSHKTENVFLITVDGLRWQEVFSGMEDQLATREFGVWDTNRLRSWFWRDTPEQRRQALMPFFREVIAEQGQLFGNGNKGSVARVTNGKNFTYPGLNEIFTGSPDDRIDSNGKR